MGDMTDDQLDSDARIEASVVTQDTAPLTPEDRADFVATFEGAGWYPEERQPDQGGVWLTRKDGDSLWVNAQDSARLVNEPRQPMSPTRSRHRRRVRPACTEGDAMTDAPFLNCNGCRTTIGRAGCPTHRQNNAVTIAPSVQWSSSGPVLTHCQHGLDLRINPRCYLCRPEAGPAHLDELRKALEEIAEGTEPDRIGYYAALRDWVHRTALAALREGETP